METRLLEFDIAAVEAAVDGLETWIRLNGWAGYDPYDIRGQDWYVKFSARQGPAWRKLRGLAGLIEFNLPPLALRRSLRVRKQVNNKAMGLFASGYLSLYRSSRSPEYLTRAEEALQWLIDHPSQGYPGISWGYPFHWMSRVFIPRGTPSAVVTGIVGDAFLDHYLITSSDSDLQVLAGIREFFLQGLNLYRKSSDEICFSYTPVDQFKVHNANLFVAAFLARLGGIQEDAGLLETALNAARYTVREQNPDGSFYYWGSEEKSHVDHYHTGFVLRHLSTIDSATGDPEIGRSLELGYRFYQEEFFTRDGLPKYTPESLYPIDIHSCAEALLVLSRIGPSLGGTTRLETVLRFVLSRMKSGRGYYYAQIRRRRGREVVVDIPYIRWGQAWMLYALASTLEWARGPVLERGYAGGGVTL